MAKEINLLNTLSHLEETSEMDPSIKTEKLPKMNPAKEPPKPPQPKPEQLPLPGFVERAQDPVKKVEREQKQLIKKIIEALLFISSEPISFQRLREVIETKIPVKPKTLRDAIDDLQDEYIIHQRAFRLEEVGQGFILRTCEEFAPFIEQLFRVKRGEKLSQASLEVLAIIAYKQPITKPQIEAIRGVDCSGIVQNLLDRELIYPMGKLEAPGRPTLYGITSHFLMHFGLKDLSELPTISKSS